MFPDHVLWTNEAVEMEKNTAEARELDCYGFYTSLSQFVMPFMLQMLQNISLLPKKPLNDHN